MVLYDFFHRKGYRARKVAYKQMRFRDCMNSSVLVYMKRPLDLMSPGIFNRCVDLHYLYLYN